MNRNQLEHYKRFGLPKRLADIYEWEDEDLREKNPPHRYYVPADEKSDTIHRIVGETPMSQRATYDEAKRQFTNISQNDIKAAFLADTEYQVLRPKKTRDTAILINADYPLHWCQIDLVGISGYPHGLSKYPAVYALTCIDVYSRYAWAELIPDKFAKTVAKALAKIINRMPKKPKTIQSDRGNEFKGETKALLEDKGIRQVMSAAYSPTTQAYIERFHRTMRRSLEHYFEKTEDELNPDLLNRFLETYNNTTHSGTNAKPAEKIREAGEPRQRVAEFEAEYAVGNRVRLSLARVNSTDRKLVNSRLGRTVKNWTEEVYVVTKVISDKAHKHVYKVKLDEPGAHLLDGFVHEYQMLRV